MSHLHVKANGQEIYGDAKFSIAMMTVPEDLA